MKDFLNVLVLLILVGLIVGTAWLQVTCGKAWAIGLVPLMFFSFLWGIKISNDYK